MNPNPQANAPRQLRLEAPANLTAAYANTVIISHTATEVIFDFVQIMPNDPRARILSRVIMTPMHAKLFLRAFGENVTHFEDKNGEIKLPPSLADQLFGGLRTTEEDDANAQPGA